MKHFAENSAPTKISIITIAFNAEKNIEQTIQSVIAQIYPHIEYIVIDGASTDKTLAIIDKYRKSITTIISEPDTGISNAMNKAIHYCSGDYLLFLHADDYLTSESSISDAVKKMHDNNVQSDIYAFGIYYGQPDAYKFIPPIGFNFWTNLKLRSGINHQGTFCARKLFAQIGLFDEGLKICMDYDWFLRAYRQKATIELHPIPLSFMRNSGISGKADWLNTHARILEEKVIHRKNQPTIWHGIFYYFWWLSYPTYKKIINKN